MSRRRTRPTKTQGIGLDGFRLATDRMMRATARHGSARAKATETGHLAAWDDSFNAARLTEGVRESIKRADLAVHGMAIVKRGNRRGRGMA